ncbi:MAG: glycosyltransferase family 2 protein [Chthoniobacterales bacterium]|jgi:glycosyltransferase involved in cell wall biosynthesis
MFSILILTKDEEANIQACLESVSWCDDVVVLDSGSTDRTREVAAARGARVFERVFDDFGAQRNHALDHVVFQHPWVFHLDADERFNEGLRSECEKVMAADQHSAYFVANRLMFLGRWIKHSSQYPYPQVRLLKIGEARFAKSGHGQREDKAQRGTGYLKATYDHLNFSKGIADWVDRHNRYSTQEAEEVASLAQGPIPLGDVLSADSLARKRALKRLHARLPARWLWKFCYLYVCRGGFLDGYPGFAYCVLNGFYDFLISVKIKESQLRSLSDGR